MSNNKVSAPKPQWVRLHLVAQTESGAMPPYVVGLLTGETPNSFILNPILMVNEGQGYTPGNYSLITRTYVWCCEVLPDKPESEDIEDGLG